MIIIQERVAEYKLRRCKVELNKLSKEELVAFVERKLDTERYNAVVEKCHNLTKLIKNQNKIIKTLSEECRMLKDIVRNETK